MRQRVLWSILALLLAARTGLAAAVPEVPVKGMVTLVDIGATACVPCKMMQPVLEAVERQYQGRAAVVFIDVWEHREQGERFGLRLIPTQIFYDKNGNETFRHEGFLDQASIAAKLDQLLAE